MLEIKANLFEPPADVDAICIPTNLCTDKRGFAIMGKGIALQAKRKFKLLPAILGGSICGIKKSLGMHGLLNEGRILRLYSWEIYNKTIDIISFPIKIDWRDKSELSFIAASAFYLRNFIDIYYPFGVIWLPRVGCGAGGLKWEDVRPVLADILDDRFVVVAP